MSSGGQNSHQYCCFQHFTLFMIFRLSINTVPETLCNELLYISVIKSVLFLLFSIPSDLLKYLYGWITDTGYSVITIKLQRSTFYCVVHVYQTSKMFCHVVNQCTDLQVLSGTKSCSTAGLHEPCQTPAAVSFSDLFLLLRPPLTS